MSQKKEKEKRRMSNQYDHELDNEINEIILRNNVGLLDAVNNGCFVIVSVKDFKKLSEM